MSTEDDARELCPACKALMTEVIRDRIAANKPFEHQPGEPEKGHAVWWGNGELKALAEDLGIPEGDLV